MRFLKGFLLVFLILLLGVGVVSASDDISSYNDTSILAVDDADVLSIVNDDASLDSVDDADVLSIVNDDAVLDSVDDGDVIDNVRSSDMVLSDFVDDGGVITKVGSSDGKNILGASKTYVDVNYYNILSDDPHSVNIYNESDYVARVYAPTECSGDVYLSIGKNVDDIYQIFNSSIQDLDKVVDIYDDFFSYYYIRPTQINIPSVPGVYYVLAEYESIFTYDDEGFVNFVEDSRHVRVEPFYEIVIGDWDKEYFNIFVEGTRGYLSVLIDGVEVINDSVFNLRYINETGDFNYYIPVLLNDLPVGEHTYNVSYYGGNWDNVTFVDTFDVTYLLDVIGEEYEVYYGDNATFLIFLPDDASSNEIKVNGKSYEIDVEYGMASLTLSDFELGNNLLNFTYDDVKYGENSYYYDLEVYPKLYIPETVRYGSDDKIILKLPSDAQGKLNVYVDYNDEWVLRGSKDLVNGEANYTFDSSWGIGSDYIFVEFEGEKYDISNQAFIEIIPNIKMPQLLYVDGDYNATIVLPENTLDTVVVNILNDYYNETIYSKNNSDGPVVISLPKLELGHYELQVIYQKFKQDNVTTTYGFDVRNQNPIWTIESELEDFNIFSNDYAYCQIKNLPSDADGVLTLYIDGERIDVFNSRYDKDFIRFNAYDYDFDLGTHEWELRFEDDSYYNDTSTSGKFEIKWINVPDIIYPDEENYNSIVFINNFNNYSGYLSLKIDGEDYALEFISEGAVIYLDDLDYGVHNYELKLVDEEFGSLTKKGTFEVGHYFDVEIDGEDHLYAGIPFTANVKLPKNITGNVIIEIDGKNYTQSISNGSAQFDIDGLSPGNHTLLVKYLGNALFPAKEISRNLTVACYKIIVQNIIEESNIIKSVSLNLPANATGNMVIYNQTGIMATIPLLNGVARYEFNNLEFGRNYLGHVSYDGDDYAVERFDYNFNLTALVDLDYAVSMGEDNYIEVDMFGITGNIIVYVNGELFKNESLADGKINLTIPSDSLHLSQNIVTLKYEGSDLSQDPFSYYDLESDEFVPYEYSVMVDPKELNIPDEFSTNGMGNISLELPDGSNGTVIVYVNDEIVSTTPVSGGENNIAVDGLNVGSNTVEVRIIDEDGYSYEISKTVNVPKPVPQVNISSSNSSIPQFTISLPSNATGSLIVDIAGEKYIKDLENGKATISIPGLANGVYDAIIKYSGDSYYSGFTKNTNVTIKTMVLKDLKLKISVPSVYQANKVVVTISTDKTFTGRISVKIKSKTYPVDVVKGVGKISISGLNVGTYTAIATFTAKGLFKSTTKSVKFKVKANVVKLGLNKATVKRSAKKVVLQASLKINGKAASGKKLKFKFNKKTYTVKVNKKGIAKLIISKSILKKLKIGKTISYQVKYGKKTHTRKVKVKK